MQNIRKPLRIFLENHSADIRQGAINDGLDLARFSDRRDLEIVFCGPSSDELRSSVKSLNCEFLPRKSLAFSRSGFPLYALSVLTWIRRLRSWQIDAVFINYTSWGASLACAANRLGVPVLARAGGIYTPSNLVFRWVDRYLANCEEQAAGLHGSPVSGRVVVAGSFVDVSTQRIERTGDPLPQRRDNIPLIVFAGQLVERKGIHVLLDAIAGLTAPVDLWLVGGDWSDPGYASEIRLQAAHLPVTCDVKFVNHRSDILSLIDFCDVFVLPSLSEARPRVIMEAMLLGKCVVGTKVGGIPSVISNNQTGKLVEAGDPHALRRVLQELIVTPHLRDKLGKRAKKFATENFDSRCTSQRYITEFRKLVS